MMNNYAVIQNGTVINIIVWDGVTPYNPGEGFTLVNITNIPCQIGWTTTNNTSFTAPAVAATPLNPQQLLANAAIFGQGLVSQFESLLISNGLTAAQIATVDSNFLAIKVLLITGSLQSALTAIQAVTPSAQVPQAVLTLFENELSSYISNVGL